MKRKANLFLLITGLALIGFFSDVEFAKRSSIAASYNEDKSLMATPSLPDPVTLWCLALGILGTCTSIWALWNDPKLDSRRTIPQTTSKYSEGIQFSRRENAMEGYLIAVLLINSLSLIILFCHVEADRRMNLAFLADTIKVGDFQNPRPVAMLCFVLGILGTCYSLWALWKIWIMNPRTNHK